MTADEAFYLHEDEWGMIELLPRENYAERKAMVAEATAHGEEHRAPGGAGWTDLFVAPAAEVSIDIRKITVATLGELLGPDWTRCDGVTHIYGAAGEDIANTFAFRPTQSKANGNVFYGTHEADRVVDLFVTECELPIMPVLHRLGLSFQLMLCDLWQDVVVDLADPAALAGYVSDNDDD
jgi:hypothetical protein